MPRVFLPLYFLYVRNWQLCKKAMGTLNREQITVTWGIRKAMKKVALEFILKNQCGQGKRLRKPWVCQVYTHQFWVLQLSLVKSICLKSLLTPSHHIWCYSRNPTEPIENQNKEYLLQKESESYILNDSLFINLMQVYKIYCTLPNKSAMKNKVQKTPQNQKPKHAKCAAVNLLAIRILKNSIMYSRFSLRFKEI